MKKTTLILVSASVAALMLSGCARQISPNVYTEAQVGESSRTYRCTVVSVRQIQVKAGERLEDNTTGMLLGGAAGGLAGSAVGGGHGNTAAIIGGAIAGGVLGSLAEEQLKTQDALEYTVELENGKIRTLVQGLDSPLRVGQDALLIIGDRGRSRLVPDNNPGVYRGNRVAKRRAGDGVQRREIVVKHANVREEEEDY
ncbi:MAG: glycine zipper 2TM domain-containing protein [Proteobacteria bacterium]|nr:glycine zipper 2TM domain-containing protein [Pseudomonadota bacterium]